MSKPLVIFSDRTDLDPEPGRTLLEQAGCETMLLDMPRTTDSKYRVPAAAKRAVALVVGYASIDKSVIDQLPDLVCIATMSAGIDMIDRAACEERGIWVMNLLDAATEEVAAHALTLLLASERNLIDHTAVVRAGGWTEQVVQVPRRLSGLTLGLYGCGRIARRFAEIAGPSVRRVIAHDPFVVEAPVGVELVDLQTLLNESDVLSLHVPLTLQTRGIADERFFANMKSGATLLNVARGELIDEAALIDSLDNGHLRAACLDVLDGEPPAHEHLLRNDSRVLVTPHVGFLSEGSLEKYTLDPARNVLGLLRGGRVSSAVALGKPFVPKV